jgi:ribosomal protein S20
MRYTKEDIEAMDKKALEELIAKEKKMKLSIAAQTIIEKNKASAKEKQLFEEFSKD